MSPDQVDAHDAPTEATEATVDTLLNEVERALADIDTGTYGECHRCLEPIDDTRLARYPTAWSCEACST
jgi:RNA polymerase-binding transcription factor DksA